MNYIHNIFDFIHIQYNQKQKEKKKVSETVRSVAKQHNKLIKVVKLYNKKYRKRFGT